MLAVAVANRWVIPLDNYIKSGNIDMEKTFIAPYIGNCTLDGQAKLTNPSGEYYGLPTLGDLYMYHYRKDLYQQDGLALAKTWDEFIKNCQKLTNPSQDFYGLALSGRTSPDSHMISDWQQIAINMKDSTLAFKQGDKPGH